MKKIFYILFFFLAFQPSFAQDDQAIGDGKLRDKMIEYIRNKLSLSKGEAEKFQPVFVDYLKELRKTNKEFRQKGEGTLELQQKLVELRVRYRDQFKPIIGEKKSNEVFDHEKEFIRTLQQEIKDRREQRRAANGKNSKLLSN